MKIVTPEILLSADAPSRSESIKTLRKLVTLQKLIELCGEVIEAKNERKLTIKKG